MFNQTAISAAQAHALAEFPNESCGIIADDEYIACENIADNPQRDFQIATETISSYIISGTLQAIVHSHPHVQFDVPSSPSKSDMLGQIATNVPWGVVDTDGQVASEPWWWGDFLLDTPLIGRNFQHGVRDCYSLIRAWYWQKREIKLPEGARDDIWWKTDDNLYVDNFAAAGFVQISRDQLADGDLVLGKVNSTKINHAGVYLDNKEDGKGLILHHLPNRLSCRQPASPWLNRAEMFLRYAP